MAVKACIIQLLHVATESLTDFELLNTLMLRRIYLIKRLITTTNVL